MLLELYFLFSIYFLKLGCDNFIGDVIFVLDSADGVSSDDWVKEKQFAVEIATRLRVSQSRTRVGVTVYGNAADNDILLNQYDDEDDLLDNIIDLRAETGSRVLYRGIRETYQEHILEENGGRAEEVTVAVIIVAGDTSSPSRGEDEAATARSNAINILSVGIADADQTLVAAISSSPREMDSSYFIVNDFNSLTANLAEDIAEQICSRTEEIPTTTTTTTTTTTIPTTTTQRTQEQPPGKYNHGA